MTLLFWAPLFAAGLHIMEEFGWPGGFADWYRRYQPANARNMTRAFFVRINIVLLLMCGIVPLIGPSRAGAALWLSVAAVLASNAVSHIVATYRTGRYSPGVATSVLVYLPMALIGGGILISHGVASVPTMLIALAIGATYPGWSAWGHQRSHGLQIHMRSPVAP